MQRRGVERRLTEAFDRVPETGSCCRRRGQGDAGCEWPGGVGEVWAAEACVLHGAERGCQHGGPQAEQRGPEPHAFAATWVLQQHEGDAGPDEEAQLHQARPFKLLETTLCLSVSMLMGMPL